jgi:hypothetical protein
VAAFDPSARGGGRAADVEVADLWRGEAVGRHGLSEHVVGVGWSDGLIGGAVDHDARRRPPASPEDRPATNTRLRSMVHVAVIPTSSSTRAAIHD